jgi:coenzyme Q-binding protein COQ10
MHSFNDTRLIPYKAELVRDIVLDIEKYPEFLPWCSQAKLLSKIKNELKAELTINFKIFTESYISQIITTENNKTIEISVEAISGPFKKLTNFWIIKKLNNECEVNFSIDFEFKSMILDGVVGTFFSIATSKIINAFETRACYIFENSVP